MSVLKPSSSEATSETMFSAMATPSSTLLSTQHPSAVRIFHALLQGILQTFLNVFRQVEHFGESVGSLQAMVDIMAIQQVMKIFFEGMPEIRGLVRLIQNAAGVSNVDQHSEFVEEVINRWMKTSEVDFLCFLGQ